MRNSAEFFQNEEPRAEIRSSLAGKGGHGSEREKRASVAEVLGKLKDIIAILPEDSKRRIGNQVEYIRKNPEQAVEIIRKEIEAQREIINLLDNDITTDEALDMLDGLLPKERVQ
jgi:hypothetical protein